MCIVVSCDCFTGVFAGFAVFATIGFLADALGESVDTYAKASGPGLAFITYPEALGQMPVSPLFSIIFFAMLLALGLGSQVIVRSRCLFALHHSIVQFASTDVIITVLMEIFPSQAKRRWMFVILSCTTFFLLSLPFACPVRFSPSHRPFGQKTSLGRNLSLRNLSRVHGEHFIGFHRLLRGGRYRLDLW